MFYGMIQIDIVRYYGNIRFHFDPICKLLIASCVVYVLDIFHFLCDRKVRFGIVCVRKLHESRFNAPLISLRLASARSSSFTITAFVWLGSQSVALK